MSAKEKANLASFGHNSHKGVYFEIRESVYLVPGVSRAAICDTNTGNVYSINKLAIKELGLNMAVSLYCLPNCPPSCAPNIFRQPCRPEVGLPRPPRPPGLPRPN